MKYERARFVRMEQKGKFYRLTEYGRQKLTTVFTLPLSLKALCVHKVRIISCVVFSDHVYVKGLCYISREVDDSLPYRGGGEQDRNVSLQRA